jgi:dolichyl-phosphate beta-glucosyltransferase
VAGTVVVVPCYNEALRFDTGAFRAGVGALDDVQLMLVDDGSTDQTADVLRRFRDAEPERADVLVLETNMGKAEAVRRGVNRAFESGAEFVGYWDADLATPLDQIQPFREVLISRPELLAVLGSRIKRLGANIDRNPGRHLAGRLFATLASLVLGLPVYDTQCGAKLFRVSDPVRRAFDAPFLTRWLFDVEILASLTRGGPGAGRGAARGAAGGSGGSSERGVERAAAGGAERGAACRAALGALYEIPLPYWRDEPGSKLGAGHMLAVPVDLLRIYRRYR